MAEYESRKRGRPRSFHSKTEATIIQSVDKAITLLKVVSEGSGRSLSELSELSGQPAASAYRALVTLQKHGMVSFDEDAQLWQVDVESFRIGSAFLANTNMVEQARAIMTSLMTETGETTNLGIIAGDEVVFLSQVETHEPIRAFFRPGTHGSIHASGIGKVLFAFRPENQAAQLAKSINLVKFTDNSIMTTDELLQMRLETLRRGFSVDDQERTMGMRCIAAPIFNSFGEAVSAISISGPTVRVDSGRIAEYGEKVKVAADAITRNIGGKISAFDA
ncbi:MAG: helix-turn-helix domain-containing protein [Rhizobiaceae bacterium]|nr:helix-turn-helix domain-containing protein [Rhizobiaceae bacterium]